MLPQNSTFQHPIAYSQPHSNGNYQFDLKLNVDFQTGRVMLNLPQNHPTPFIRKEQIPLVNSTIYTHQSFMPYSNYPLPKTYSQKQFSIFPHFQQQNRNNDISFERLPTSEMPENNANSQKYSLNTTLFHTENVRNQVECVICQKLIKQQDFDNHLVEHRKRKRDQLQLNQFNNTNGPGNSISIRNINEQIQFFDAYPNSPRSMNRERIIEANNVLPSEQGRSISQSSINFINAHQRSLPNNISARQIQNSNRSSQSSFYLSHSTNPQAAQFSNLENTPNEQQEYQMARPISFNQRSIHQEYSHQPNFAPPNQLKQMHPLQMHRIQSMIIRPQQNRAQQYFEECGQSDISRRSLPTKYEDIQTLERQFHHNELSESSSDEDESLRVNPASKTYHSTGWSKRRESFRSNLTEKIGKTKLPVNYLARQEFITNSTHHTMSDKFKNHK